MNERHAFIDALLALDDPEELRNEIRQFLLDAMDITSQGDVEPAAQAAYTAFIAVKES